MMIPKILHYVWLGGAAPGLFLDHCRASISELHPEWSTLTHTSPEVLHHPSLPIPPANLLAAWERAASCSGRHNPLAVQSDLLRLVVLYLYGGIYLDSDMWGIQPLDKFACHDFLVGEIRPGLVAEALIGVPPESPLIAALLIGFLERRPVIDAGLPHLNNVCMGLPYFCEEYRIKPYSSDFFVGSLRKAPADHRYRLTANTHTLHCWHREFTYEVERLREVRLKVEALKRLKDDSWK